MPGLLSGAEVTVASEGFPTPGPRPAGTGRVNVKPLLQLLGFAMLGLGSGHGAQCCSGGRPVSNRDWARVWRVLGSAAA